MTWGVKRRSDREYQADESEQSRPAPRPPAPGKRTLVGPRYTQRVVRRAVDAALLRAEETAGRGRGEDRARDERGVQRDAPARVDAARGSSGRPLPAPLQKKFEGSLGADLSHVRIHTGPDSASAAAAVGAKAYTIGRDIHFAAGRYDPASSEGERLLAHEVAHTVQQEAMSPVRQNQLEVSQSGDAAEREADSAADAMVAGRAAAVSSDHVPATPSASAVVAREEEEEETAWWNPKVAPELSLKPPLVSGWNEGTELKIKFSEAGTLTGSATVAGEHKGELTGDLAANVGPVLFKGLISGAVGVKANIGLEAQGSAVRHDNPDLDYFEPSVSVTGGVEFFAEGKAALLAGAGVPDVANVTGGAQVTLSAKLAPQAKGGGGVKIGRDGVQSGSINIEVDMTPNIKAVGSLVAIAEFVNKNVTLAELNLVEHPIAEYPVKVKPKVTLPGGENSGTEETGPFKFLGVPTGQVTQLERGGMQHAIATIQAAAHRAQMEAELGPNGMSTLEGTCEEAPSGPDASMPPAPGGAEGGAGQSEEPSGGQSGGQSSPEEDGVCIDEQDQASTTGE